MFRDLETKVVRAGAPSPRIDDAVVTPIFQSATFGYAGETSYHELRYIRLNNTPTHSALHAKLAAMESGEAALAAASGMAAIFELFYITGDGTLMAVSVTADGAAGRPVPLFPAANGYQAAADGQRFLVPRRVASAGGSITIVLNSV